MNTDATSQLSKHARTRTRTRLHGRLAPNRFTRLSVQSPLVPCRDCPTWSNPRASRSSTSTALLSTSTSTSTSTKQEAGSRIDRYRELSGTSSCGTSIDDPNRIRQSCAMTIVAGIANSQHPHRARARARAQGAARYSYSTPRPSGTKPIHPTVSPVAARALS